MTEFFNIFLYGTGLFLCLFWLWVVMEAGAFQKRSSQLRSLNTESEGRDFSAPPLVSIIVPARNEEDAIGSCLESLLRQTYSPLEIFAVNDRSSDRTGEIMDSLAARYPQIQVLHISQLPEGWLGKNNALHLASKKVGGKFILFTDGDVIFEDLALEEATGCMINHSLDHLVLGPKFISSGPLIGALQCFFAVIFLVAMRPSRIGKSKKHYIGAGAFNMVRAGAYRKIGGHQALRLEVIDDIMLGKLMVINGGVQAVVDGQDLISLEWYSSAKDMILGLEKNGFAALRYSLARLSLLTLFNFTINLLPYLVVVFAPLPLKIFYGAILLMAHTIFCLASYKMGLRLWTSLLIPLASWCMYFAHLRSTFLTLSRGKVVWRETGYSLTDLKKNMIH